MLRHVGILSKDLKKSIKFYKKWFDMRLVCQETLPAHYTRQLLGTCFENLTYCKLAMPASSILLEIYEVNYIQPTFNFHHISLTVKDIDSLYRRMKKTVFFYQPPVCDPANKHKVCFCMDPDKNIIELVQPLSKASAIRKS